VPLAVRPSHKNMGSAASSTASPSIAARRAGSVSRHPRRRRLLHAAGFEKWRARRSSFGPSTRRVLACRLPPMPTAAHGPNRLAPEAPVSQASCFFIQVIERSPMKFSMLRRLDALAHRRGGSRVDRVDIGAVQPRASPRPRPLQQPAGEALSAKMLRNVEERPRRASRAGIADESASSFPTGTEGIQLAPSVGPRFRCCGQGSHRGSRRALLGNGMERVRSGLERGYGSGGGQGVEGIRTATIWFREGSHKKGGMGSG